MLSRPGRTPADVILGRLALSEAKEEVNVRTDVWQRIEEARGRWNVLEHPFYQRWSAGELSREELARYAGQYRHATAAIARLSATWPTPLPRPSVRELRRHAAGGGGPHRPVGWFCRGGRRRGRRGADASRRRPASSPGSPPMRRLAQLVRLYAIESGQPAISATKREGLAAHYGIDDGPGNEYFRVHEKADVEHAAEGRSLIEAHLADAERADETLIAAAEAAFRANWRLLDGV